MIFELFAKRLFPQAFNNDLSELEPKHIFLRKSVNHLGFKFGLTMLLILYFWVFLVLISLAFLHMNKI